jgi:hypothetical protein
LSDVEKTPYTDEHQPDALDHKEKPMKFVRSATLAAVAVLAIAGSALAATSLHQTPPLDAADYKSGECGDTVVPDGKVLWHFVLTQTEATEGSLTVEFGYPVNEVTVPSSKNTGGVLHFNVLSDIGQVVLSAVSTADGDQLNLSHTCYSEVQPSVTPSVEPSTAPSATPSVQPSVEPTPTPSPSTTPSETPSPSSTPSATVRTPTSSSSTPAGATLPPTDTTTQSSGTIDPEVIQWLAIVALFVMVIYLLMFPPDSRD